MAQFRDTEIELLLCFYKAAVYERLIHYTRTQGERSFYENSELYKLLYVFLQYIRKLILEDDCIIA